MTNFEEKILKVSVYYFQRWALIKKIAYFFYQFNITSTNYSDGKFHIHGNAGDKNFELKAIEKLKKGRIRGENSFNGVLDGTEINIFRRYNKKDAIASMQYNADTFLIDLPIGLREKTAHQISILNIIACTLLIDQAYYEDV